MFLSKFKELTKDTSFYGLGQILGQLIGFFLIPFYTKYLSPSDYGIMTILGFYTLFYTPISHLGIQGAMFRFLGLAKNNEEEGEILSTSIISVFCISLFITILAQITLFTWEFILLDSSDYSKFLSITIWGAFAASLSQMGYAFLRVKRKVKSIFILNVINLIINIGLNILLIAYFNMGLLGSILSTAITSFISLFLVFIISKLNFSLGINRQKLYALLQFGLPNLPHYLFVIIMMLFGQFMLNKYNSAEELGFYAVAWKFCLPFSSLTGIVHSSWSAYKYDLVKSSGKDAPNLLGKFIQVMMVIFSFFYVSTAIFGGEILKWMTDEKFHRGIVYLPYLALIPLFNGLYSSIGSGVSIGKKQYYMPLISFSGALVTVLLSYWLVVDYGVNGSALVTAIGWGVMSVLVYFYSQRNYPIEMNLISIFLLLGICLATLLCITYFNWSLIGKFSLFIISVILIFISLGRMQREKIVQIVFEKFGKKGNKINY